MEINTSGFRYNKQEAYPQLDILIRYKELGGEIITVGSDAHSIHFISLKFDYAYELLKKAGFSYVTLFKKRVAIFRKI